MRKTLSPHALDLITDAALKAFWRKRTLRTFLKRCGASDGLLSTWADDESKREFLGRFVAAAEPSDSGQTLLLRAADSLAEMTRFPDLENWEDSELKIRSAHLAVQALRTALERHRHVQDVERDAVASRARIAKQQEEQRAARHTLASLHARLTELASRLGTAEAGYRFQDWLFDLLDLQELPNRRPYVAPDGRQIDGSVTLEGTTYLLELTFTGGPTGAPDVDTALKKVTDKADNTMGLMISMSGFTDTAVRAASTPRTPLLLVDSQHIFLMLGGVMTFAEVVARMRRHCSQTGHAYLRASDFGGA